MDQDEKRELQQHLQQQQAWRDTWDASGHGLLSRRELEELEAEGAGEGQLVAA